MTSKRPAVITVRRVNDVIAAFTLPRRLHVYTPDNNVNRCLPRWSNCVTSGDSEPPA